MNEETMKEIVKAYAYNQAPEQVAIAYRITLEEAQRLFAEQTAEIAEEKAYLKEMGYFDE